MPLRERSLCIGWVKSEIGAGESELSSQRSDVADCGDLTVEYGIYRKSDRFFETKRDPD